MSRLLLSAVREPIAQFVAAGAILFTIHGAVAPRTSVRPTGDDDRRIVVDAAFVRSVD